MAVALFAACAPVRAAPPELRAASAVETISPPEDGFYSKRIWYGHIPIKAHASASDESLFAARERLERMLGRAPEIRSALERAGHELHIVALRQLTSDLPEHRPDRGTRLDSGELFDWHMIGGHITGRFSSCTEATLLDVVGHRLYGDDTCLHELAHAVDLLALDRAWHERIVAQYKHSLMKGEYKNPREYFADLTKYYFRTPNPYAAVYNPSLARGRDWLRETDPGGYDLVAELYAGAHVGPLERIHLALRPGADAARLRSGPSNTPVDVRVRNDTSELVRVVWIDFDGARDKRPPHRAPPHDFVDVSTFPTHVFAIVHADGRALCTFVAGDADAIVDFAGPCVSAP
jgi:hypothetical protein